MNSPPGWMPEEGLSPNKTRMRRLTARLCLRRLISAQIQCRVSSLASHYGPDGIRVANQPGGETSEPNPLAACALSLSALPPTLWAGPQGGLLFLFSTWKENIKSQIARVIVTQSPLPLLAPPWRPGASLTHPGRHYRCLNFLWEKKGKYPTGGGCVF